MRVWAQGDFLVVQIGIGFGCKFLESHFLPLTPGMIVPISKDGLDSLWQQNVLGWGLEAITHQPCSSGSTVLNSVSLKIFTWTPPFNANINRSCHGLHFTHKESQAWSCITWPWSYQNQWWSWGQVPVLYRRRRPSRTAAGMQLSPGLRRRPCSSCLRGSCLLSPPGVQWTAANGTHPAKHNDLSRQSDLALVCVDERELTLRSQKEPRVGRWGQCYNKIQELLKYE